MGLSDGQVMYANVIVITNISGCEVKQKEKGTQPDIN